VDDERRRYGAMRAAGLRAGSDGSLDDLLASVDDGSTWSLGGADGCPGDSELTSQLEYVLTAPAGDERAFATACSMSTRRRSQVHVGGLNVAGGENPQQSGEGGTDDEESSAPGEMVDDDLSGSETGDEPTPHFHSRKQRRGTPSHVRRRHDAPLTAPPASSVVVVVAAAAVDDVAPVIPHSHNAPLAAPPAPCVVVVAAAAAAAADDAATASPHSHNAPLAAPPAPSVVVAAAADAATTTTMAPAKPSLAAMGGSTPAPALDAGSFDDTRYKPLAVGAQVVIMANTSPGVDPIHSTTVMARVKKYEGGGSYVVVPVMFGRERRVRWDQLSVGCVDGMLEVFQRGGAPNSTCVREVTKARKKEQQSMKQAEEEKKKRKRAEEKTSKAEGAAAAAKRERDALHAGPRFDPKDPRLSKKGLALAAALLDKSTKGRLMKQLKSSEGKCDEAVAEGKRLADKVFAEHRLKQLANERVGKLKKEMKKVVIELRSAQNKEKNQAKKGKKDMPEALRERFEGLEADVVEAEERAEVAEEEVEVLNAKILELMRREVGQGSKVDLGSSKDSETHLPLWMMLGKKSESYSQDVVELGFSLMSLRLSAPTAVSVMQAFLRVEYPNKVEGVDYRVPDAARFIEWRRYLDPICHYLALSVIAVADRTHIIHDATTKNHIHIIQSVYRCELKQPDGSTMVVDVPLKFDVCPSGKAEAEAQQLQSHLSSSLDGGVRASLINTASSTSDNAARATSNELRILSVQEVESAKAAIDNHLESHPDVLSHAVEAYLKLSEEQQLHAGEMHTLGCTGHSLNLTTDDCWAKSEKSSIKANMVRDRAARVLQRCATSLHQLKGNTIKKAVFKGYVYTTSTTPPPRRYRPESTREDVPRSKGFTADFVAAIADVEQKRVGPGVVKLVPDLLGDNVPDPTAVLRTTSLGFAVGGEHNEYYLNESRALLEWAVQRGRSLVHLPAVRGSRQSVNVKLATAVLANLDVYLDYDDEVRVDSAPNQLLSNQWDGLRNRFVVAALRSRSLIDVCFTSPMTFFTHHVTVTRPMIRTIMDCAESWLKTLEGLSHVGFVEGGAGHPVELQGVARRILAIYPELKPAYDSWWAHQREDLEAAFAIATDRSQWWMVAGHLRDAAPFMIETHERNLDDDAAGVAELEHAPKTSDAIESTFAVLDRTLVLGANTHALFGVAHAQLIKAFDTKASKEKRAKEKVLKRARSSGSSGAASGEVDVQVAAWDTTGYFSLPREKRWRLIKDVQRNYRDLCVLAPKEKRKEHDAVKVERLKAARAAEIIRCLNRAAKYTEFARIVPCTSIAELEALRAGHPDAKGYSKALRDQIRVRQHVFGIKQKDLPPIGDDTDDNVAARLGRILRDVVVLPLPVKPPPPPPYPIRAQHVAPTDRAVVLDRQHLIQVSEAWGQLMAMTTLSVFRVPRQRAHRSPRPATQKPRQDVPAQDQALSGEVFTEDRVEWKVLSPMWSELEKQVVVWYYDIKGAAVGGVGEEEMRAHAAATSCGVSSPGPCPPPLERSTVMEIREWILASQGTPSAAEGAPGAAEAPPGEAVAME
jgi:hypothetical protein